MKKLLLLALLALAVFLPAAANATAILGSGTTPEDSVSYICRVTDTVGQPCGGLDSTKIWVRGPSGDSISCVKIATVGTTAPWTIFMQRKNTGYAETTWVAKAKISNLIRSSVPGKYTVEIETYRNTNGGSFGRITPTWGDFQYTGTANGLSEYFIAARDSNNIIKLDGSAFSTHASGMIPADLRDIAGSALSTTTAQLGVNVVNLGGTAQTGRDIGASVLLSSGTGAGQVSLSSGLVNVGNLTTTQLAAVWDVTLSGHSTSGTFGNTNQTGGGGSAGLSLPADSALIHSLMVASIIANTVSAPTNFTAFKINSSGGIYLDSTAAAVDGVVGARELAAIPLTVGAFGSSLDFTATMKTSIGTSITTNTVAAPANFSSFAVDASGRIDVGKWIGTAVTSGTTAGKPDVVVITNNDKTGYSATVTSFGTAVLSSTNLPATLSTIPAGLTLSSGAVIITPADKALIATAVADKDVSAYSATGLIGTLLKFAGTPSNFSTATQLTTAVWSEPAAGYSTAGTFGNNLDAKVSTIGGGSLTYSGIAGSVWNALRASYTTAGSFGQGIASVQGNVTGNVTGSVGSVSGLTVPTNFNLLSINGSGQVAVASMATGSITSGAFAAGAINNASINSDARIGIDWSRISNATTTVNFSATTVASLTSAVNIATSDKNTFVDLVWDEPASGHSTAGTYGKYLDAQVSLIGGAGGGWSDAEKLAVIAATTADSGLATKVWTKYGTRTLAGTQSWTPPLVTLATLQPNYAPAKAGDAMTITGFTPGDVGAIKAQTDKLVFTTTNRLDATVYGIATGVDFTAAMKTSLNAATPTVAGISGVTFPNNFSQLLVQNLTGYVFTANGGSGGGTGAGIGDSSIQRIDSVAKFVENLLTVDSSKWQSVNLRQLTIHAQGARETALSVVSKGDAPGAYIASGSLSASGDSTSAIGLFVRGQRSGGYFYGNGPSSNVTGISFVGGALGMGIYAEGGYYGARLRGIVPEGMGIFASSDSGDGAQFWAGTKILDTSAYNARTINKHGMEIQGAHTLGSDAIRILGHGFGGDGIDISSDSSQGIYFRLSATGWGILADSSTRTISGISGGLSLSDTLVIARAVWNAKQSDFSSVSGSFGDYLDNQISLITGPAGIYYPVDITPIDTSTTPDTVLNAIEVVVTNRAQNIRPYRSIVLGDGKAHFQLSPGIWVAYTSAPGYALKLDTFTVAGSSVDTLRLSHGRGGRTTIIGTVTDFFGRPYVEPRVKFELVSKHDSLLYVNGVTIPTGQRLTELRGTSAGTFYGDIYPNSVFTNDSTYYLVTIKDSRDVRLIDRFCMRVPQADTMVNYTLLPRWSPGR